MVGSGGSAGFRVVVAPAVRDSKFVAAGAQARAKELEEQEKDTQTKLDRAEKLVGGLGSERTRWEELCRVLREGQARIRRDEQKNPPRFTK